MRLFDKALLFEAGESWITEAKFSLDWYIHGERKKWYILTVRVFIGEKTYSIELVWRGAKAYMAEEARLEKLNEG